MQRPPIFSNTPKLASHKGNYGRDYIKQLVMNRYKEIFLSNGSKHSRKPHSKPIILRKKQIRSPSPTQSQISTLIEKEVNSFLINNPLSAQKLKELESSLRVKVSEIQRNQTLSALPTAPTQKLKNIKAIRKSYNQSPLKRRASLGAENKDIRGLQIRRVSEIGSKREKMAKQAFLSKTVAGVQDIETALIPSNRAEIVQINGKEETPLKSDVKMFLPELSPSMNRSKRGLEIIGLGGGATTSETFNFKEKEKDEWHRLVQMEVAMEFEKERQKKVQAYEQHRKFRSELDQQIKERNKKIEKQRQEEQQFMAKQMEYVAQEEQKQDKKKQEQKRIAERQKTEQRALLEKLRKRKEEQFKREREEEMRAAERVRKLCEQDQMKKFQKVQNERDRIMAMMQENENNQKLMQEQKELERMADQRTLRELERRIIEETKRRKDDFSSKEKIIDSKANENVQKLESEKRERFNNEQKLLREYQQKMRKETEEEEQVRKQKKAKERELNKEALGAQIREKQARMAEERKKAEQIAKSLKSQDLSELEIHELKQMKIRERNIENRKALMEQIEENKRKKQRGMSPQEINLNKQYLSKADQVLKKYESSGPIS